MVTNQAYLFLIFSFTGIFIAILFDIFRIKRKVFKTSNFMTYIEDFTFWILTTTIILFVIWFFNNGEIRFFMLLGLLIGIIIYILLLSDIFTKFGYIILNNIKNIIKTIIKTIYKTINPIIILFANIYNKIKEKNVKYSKKLTKKEGNL